MLQLPLICFLKLELCNKKTVCAPNIIDKCRVHWVFMHRDRILWTYGLTHWSDWTSRWITPFIDVLRSYSSLKTIFPSLFQIPMEYPEQLCMFSIIFFAHVLEQWNSSSPHLPFRRFDIRVVNILDRALSSG